MRNFYRSSCYIPLSREKTDSVRQELIRRCIKMCRKTQSSLLSRTKDVWKEKLEEEYYAHALSISLFGKDPGVDNSKHRFKDLWFGLMEIARLSVEEYRDRSLQEVQDQLKLLEGGLVEEYFRTAFDPQSQYLGFLFYEGDLYFDIGFVLDTSDGYEYFFPEDVRKSGGVPFIAPEKFPPLRSFEEARRIFEEYLVGHPDLDPAYRLSLTEVVEDRGNIYSNFWKKNPRGIICAR